jgi:hypothetical protein
MEKPVTTQNWERGGRRMGKLVWHDFGSGKGLKSTLRAIESRPLANKSYANLREKGLRSKLFLELAAVAVSLAAQPKPVNPYSGSGITAPTAAYFPKQLRDIAEKIERFSANPLFYPDTADDLKLPEALRNYAKRLEDRIKLLRHSKQGRPGALGQVLAGLRCLVRNETGKERPAEIAKVLMALATGTDAHEFDFESKLKMDAYRHPFPLVSKK